MIKRWNVDGAPTPAAWHGLDELFDSLMRKWPELRSNWMATAKDFGLELEVGENEVVATVPLPGCRSEEIEVEVNGDFLRVQARRKDAAVEEGVEKRYLKRERTALEYSETVRLPVRVVGETAAAEYGDGVLTIRLPRENDQRKNHRVIKVD